MGGGASRPERHANPRFCGVACREAEKWGVDGDGNRVVVKKLSPVRFTVSVVNTRGGTVTPPHAATNAETRRTRRAGRIRKYESASLARLPTRIVFFQWNPSGFFGFLED